MALIYLALSIVYFFPAFLPGRQIYGTDYLAGGFPFYSFVGNSLSSGQLPTWVPYLFGGMPLSANPGSAYYPVQMVLAALLPVDRLLASVFVFQFWIAGIGMYLLARELGCRGWVAFVTGLAFQFTGITASWVYAGHDGRVIVATWAPMVLFFLHRGIRTGRVAPFAGAAAALGMEFLSFQIQNSYYVLLTSALWAVFCLVHHGVARRPAALARTVALGLGAVAFAFALAAVDFLPFTSYVPQSPRAGPEGRGYEFSTSYSMPPVGIVAMAVPEHVGASVIDPETERPAFPSYRVQGGFKLHTEYVGALALVLLAAGIAVSRKRREWWFFAGLSIFALTMALGGNTPLFRLYYAVLPGLKQFRAPDLIYFVIALSVVAMAGLTLERLAELRAGARDRRGALTPDGAVLQRALWIGLGMAGVALLGAAAAGGGPEGAGRAAGWVRFALFAGFTAALLAAWARGRLRTPLLAWLLAAVTVVDLWIIDRRFFYTYPSADQVFAADDVVDFIRSQPGPLRIWTFPVPSVYHASSPNGGNYPMVFGIEQLGGEHPNPLKRFTEYLGAGEQVMVDWHHFVQEMGEVQTPQGAAIAFRGAPGFMDAANVRLVVSMAPLSDPALREVFRGSALVYENTRALPRAYLVPALARTAPGAELRAMETGWDPRQTAFVADTARITLPGGPLQGGARVLRHEPGRVDVRVQASRAAFLVLADNYYPGWRATVDGRATPVYLANHTFRGVAVPAGSHLVSFRFEPGDLFTGLYLSCAAAGALALYGAFLLFRLRRRRAGEDPARTEPAGGGG
ncbi:MAG: YfhO family protein [Longimicrobiaceae bacterium]